jgi:hypothetical protein
MVAVGSRQVSSSEALSTKKGALRIDHEPKAPSEVAGRLFCRPATNPSGSLGGAAEESEAKTLRYKRHFSLRFFGCASERHALGNFGRLSQKSGRIL